MKYFFFFLFLITASCVDAQSTGYMGKRVQISYAFNASPVLFGTSSQNTTLIGDGGNAETGEFALNMIHEGSLEFMLSSKWILGLSARYYKTVYDNAKEVSRPYNSNYNFKSESPEGYYDIRGLSYALYFKYFGKRYVAPWGRYVMFGPVVNTHQTTYSKSTMFLKGQYHKENTPYYYSGSYYRDTTISNFGPSQQNFTGFNILLGWGRSRVISNRVTIDYGANFQLFSVLSGFFDAMDIGLFDNYYASESEYIEVTSKRRIRGVNRFNVFLKVGVLLF